MFDAYISTSGQNRRTSDAMMPRVPKNMKNS
jgi:hypothetical protein